ncbi:MAG: membrane protein insertase YidC, partial [Planctomycetaceae bacterium]|nr:membrane protein insertase YidC [Planctomycetaceae bacterium]
LAKAQMDLMKESGFFSGCLPMLLQIPIFFALYQALYTSVDLRMAQFLWIDNLAAPDQMFRMPFAIPWLGQDFNLLPIISVGLMILQQKMFAPPAANEEQAMQQKMMGYMMIVIGFMFYRMPAGLCIYFIASSLWAVAERKMLDWKGVHGTPGGAEPPKVNPEKKPAPAPETPPKSSWLKDTLGALDAAANPGQKKPNRGTDPNRMQGGKNRGKSKR